MAIDQWFAGPRKKPKGQREGPPRRVLFVLDPSMFFKRDAKGTVLSEVSESMLRQALSKFDKVVVFPVYGLASAQVLQEAVATYQLEVEVAPLVSGATNATVAEMLKQKLISLGAEIKHHLNPREISHLNIEKFMISDHILIARREDWAKAGLELDKPESFEDVAKKRKNRSFWK